MFVEAVFFAVAIPRTADVAATFFKPVLDFDELLFDDLLDELLLELEAMCTPDIGARGVL